MIAQGLADLKEGESSLGAIFKQLQASVFPFNVKAQETKDAAQLEQMKKEVAKGAVFFDPVVTPSPWKDKVKTMAVPGDFLKKMSDRKALRK